MKTYERDKIVYVVEKYFLKFSPPDSMNEY